MLAMVLALAVIQGPVTPAAPLHYRIEAKTTSEQDLTSMGRGKLTGGLATTAFVSVTLTDSAEGQIVRVTVDSMKLEPTGQMTTALPLAAAGPVADSARGSFVRSYAVRGALRGAPQASNASPALATIVQAMNVFFPGLRSAMKVGDSWADTTNVDTPVQGNGVTGRQTGRIVATWKVTGMEDGAFVLDGTALTTMVSNASNGSVVKVTGRSQEHMIMPGRGPARSATIESSNDITQTTSQQATPIPARSSGSLRLIHLP